MRLLWLLIALVEYVKGMCPRGCSCESSMVRCDGTPLLDIPSFLNPRIKSLSLSNCSLQRLDPDLLEFYSDLEFLDVSDNLIDQLEVELFEYQAKLRVLRLSGNKLTSINRGFFKGLTKLQMLDLSNNRLQKIESNSLEELTALVELKLSGNSLATIHPATFSELIGLRTLDLSSNDIERIDIETFKYLKFLEVLDLTNNRISVIMPNAFGQQSYLKRLGLGSNQIASLPEASLYGVTSLQHLNLSNNLLERTPVLGLRSLNSLLRLDLSKNLFIELTTSSFDGLSSLESLTLSHADNLRMIHLNAFSGLPGLREMNLSSCSRLEYINENAFEYSDRLRVLDLSNCALKSLHPKLLKWKKLETLRLSGNPMRCDCELLSFLPNVASKLNVEAACATPSHLASKNISALSSSCSSWSEAEISLLAVFSLLALISAVVLVGIFLRRRMKWFNVSRKTRIPFYDRPLLISSLPYDKEDKLSNQTYFTVKHHDCHAVLDDYKEDEYYSSLVVPAAYNQVYELPKSCQQPIPPPETTIPLPPKEFCCSNDHNFRIISAYPVPITEL